MITILKGIMGSHCHGLNTEKSDIDVRGVALKPEPEYLFGLRKFEQHVVQTDEEDITIWELRKFVRLCMKCNTNGLNLLFCEEKSLTKKNDFGCRLREIRHKFLSNRAYPVLKGYYHAEYRHTMGTTTGRLGEKRKNDITEHGYSVKNASHCIRLMITGTILFRTGNYPVWFDDNDRKLLLELKTGMVDKESFEKMFGIHLRKFEDAYEHSHLPNVPAENEIWAEVMDYISDVLEAQQWET